MLKQLSKCLREPGNIYQEQSPTPTVSKTVSEMSRALSDEEASKEMKKMVTFIMQEASEKAKEIRIKADEEFNIEKAKLVLHETTSIEANFSKRLGQAEVKRKIAQSNQINKTRLKVLQFRDERLNEIISEARDTLISIKKDMNSYSNLLLNLCLDVLYRLMENEVTIECTPDDLELVKVASKKAANLFKESTMIDISINVVGIMPEENCGGIIGSCRGGRIRCSNTLADRLSNISEKALPDIRNILFGVSQNRKFTN